MDFPFLLLALLALPFAVAAAIVLVSSVRRRGHAPAHEQAAEPTHRLQAETAGAHGRALYPRTMARRVRSGRERRAASAARSTAA